MSNETLNSIHKILISYLEKKSKFRVEKPNRHHDRKWDKLKSGATGQAEVGRKRHHVCDVPAGGEEGIYIEMWLVGSTEALSVVKKVSQQREAWCKVSVAN